ncbi:membrane metallo-endopeptidase-like 1 [Haemaphysalis longicornis]
MKARPATAREKLAAEKRRKSSASSTSSKALSNKARAGQQLDRSCQVILFACVALVAVAVTGLLVLVVRLLSGPHVRICVTEHCKAHAEVLRAAMNSSVNPCNDFYRFTCGSWKPKGAEASVIRYTFAQTAQRVIQEMNNKAGSLVPAAPAYYQSCINTAKNSTHELALFKRFKQGLGLLWPEAPHEYRSSPHPLDVLLNMSINWNYHMFFLLRAFPKYRERPPTLYIRRGKLGPEWQKIAPQEFEKTVKSHLEALGANAEGSHDALYDVTKKMMDSSISIPPGAAREQQINLDGLNAYMPQNYARLRKTVSAMLAPTFSWHGNSPVFLEDTSILTKLESLLKEFESNVPLLMQGLSWVFIRDNLWVVAGKPGLRHSGDKGTLQAHFERACLGYVESSFGLAVLAKHIYARYDEAMRQKLDTTFQFVKDEVSREVDSSSWIETRIKRKIEDKIKDLALNALPGDTFFTAESLTDLYKSFSSSVSESFMQSYINLARAYKNILGTDSYVSIYSKRSGGGDPSRYNYYYNIAFLSLAAMEPPILYSGGLLAMTFASVGTLMAECMVRSFDTQGAKVDEKGKDLEWWGPAKSDKYRERAQCDLVSDSGVKSEQRQHLLATLFPLVPALTASFKAFRKAVDAQAIEEYTEDQRLPGLEDFSDLQVFFMTYCLMRCRLGSDGNDCNLPVRHTPSFASAFRCSQGSPMNPTKKCRFLA